MRGLPFRRKEGRALKGANRRRSRRASSMTAFCGLTAALSITLMLTGGLIPLATYIAPLMASALLVPVCLEFSLRAGWGTWGVTALIALVLGLDKEAALLYGFVGWWPLAKGPLERRVRGSLPRLLLKAGIFAGSVALQYVLMVFLLHMEAVTAEFGEMGQWMTVIFFVTLLVCLLLYDRLLTPLAVLYQRRIRPKLRFLRRG